MPHLKIDYCANLDGRTDMGALCLALSARLAALRSPEGAPIFPLAGTRVLACPAPHHAVADGRDDFSFVYLNFRITPGRSRALVEAVGEALLATVRSHFAPLQGQCALGVTLHIDEIAPAFEGKFSNLVCHLATGASGSSADPGKGELLASLVPAGQPT